MLKLFARIDQSWVVQGWIFTRQEADIQKGLATCDCIHCQRFNWKLYILSTAKSIREFGAATVRIFVDIVGCSDN